MIEIIIHGRGGQGAFTAAKLLGAAAALGDGVHSLAYPSFGPERRGAPIRAFVKIDSAQIGDRSEVKRADYVVYLDETLFAENWEDELKEDGVVLLNSKLGFDDARVKCIDASGIALEVLGRDIPNTVFVAAIATLSDKVSLTNVETAIRDYMPAKLVEKNLAVIEKFATCKQGLSPRCTPRADNHAGVAKEMRECVAAGTVPFATERGGVIIPKLIKKLPAKEQFCHNTCGKAGMLVTKNCGWRLEKPVVDKKKCTGCFQCYMACPDGCVFKAGEDRKKVAIDYDFCKGCAICARACKFDAIKMVAERGESSR